MATIAAPHQTTGAALAGWARRRPLQAVGVLGFFLSLLVFLAMLPGLAQNGGFATLTRNIGYHVYVVAWVLLVTAVTRTVSLRTVVSWWFVGFFPVVALNFLLQRPMGLLVGRDSTFLSTVWVPTIEEVTKALPLALIVVLGVYARRLRLGPSDLIVLGMVLGSGFAIHEDALWGRVGGSGFASPVGIVFPAFWSPSDAIVPGHLGWTGVVGAAVAVLAVLRWFGWRSPLAWGIPILALGVVTFDHGLHNYLIGAPRGTLPTRVLTTVSEVLGPLQAGGLVLAVLAAVAIEAHRLQVGRKEDRGLPVLTAHHLQAALRAPNGPSKVTRLYACVQYLRHSNAERYSAASRGHPLQAEAVGHATLTWGRLAGILR